MNNGMDEFRLLFDNLPDAAFILDDGRFVDCNQTALSIMGCTDKDQILGKKPLDLSPEKQRDGTLSRLKSREFFKISGDLRRNKFPWVHRKLDGEEIAVEVHLANLHSNGKTIVCALWKDITELSKVEKALLEKEEQYERLISCLPEIVLVHRNEIILFANHATESILGYPPEEMVNTSIFDYIDNSYKTLIQGNIQKRIDDEEVGDYEIKMVTKTGDLLAVIVKAQKIIYKGEPAHLVVLFDITERKKTEEQFRHSQKMESIGLLAGGVAHDFKNIITAIMGFGNLLHMKLPANNPLNTYVDHILSASEKAAQLTQSLLAFSRKQPINLQPVSLNKVIKGLEKLLSRLLTEDIEFRITLIDQDLVLMADTIQIEQVMMNMAANARDAMPHGGTLIIKTEPFDIDSEFCRTHGYGIEGAYALISVTDTGIGMNKQTKERIFEPFFTTKDVGKGTGLGLSTVYGIIKQHNGYITVKSIQDSGTTFKIYLPLSESKPIQIKKSKQVFSKKGTETILIAEDNPDVRLLNKTILKEAGYRVIEAKDGKEAVEHFVEFTESIDMVILDVVMPGKNGKETYQEIRRLKNDIKVLFTSGYTSDVILTKGVHDKQYELLMKPTSSEIFLQKVREILDRR